jgi:hypothetical protein
VHLTGADSCTVTASQPGDANYNPAPAVSRRFAIARRPCRVPKVVGKKLSSAKRTITKSHCRTGKIGHAYSRKNKKDIVVYQSRRPESAAPGSVSFTRMSHAFTTPPTSTAISAGTRT